MTSHELPFVEFEISDTIVERVFSQNIPDDDLKWHIDSESRIIKPYETSDWMLQLDNDLPQYITKSIFIPKGMYHRLIKGTSDLRLRILKLQ